MAQESCNLDKDEAEILKPTTSPPPPSSPPSQTTAPPPPPPSLFLKPSQDFQSQRPERPGPLATPSPPASRSSISTEGPHSPAPRFCNRCSSCRKKVGLTGFRCRCGDLFCGRHRYSDTHDCSFDYKAAGREEISKANPVIRAAKIIKI